MSRVRFAHRSLLLRAVSWFTLVLVFIVAPAGAASAQSEPTTSEAPNLAPPAETEATDMAPAAEQPTDAAPAAERPTDATPVAAESTTDTAPATAEGEDDEDESSEVVHEPHRHAIFAYPYALLRRGIVLGYEYAVPDTRLGLVVEYSFERRARGDFRSTASGFGLGWRFYFMGKSRFGTFSGRACVGPFIGGMGSLRIVGVRETDGRDVIGRATRATAEGQLGVRFPIRAKAELSTLVTAALSTDFVSGLALQLRPSVGFALTVGMLL